MKSAVSAECSMVAVNEHEEEESTEPVFEKCQKLVMMKLNSYLVVLLEKLVTTLLVRKGLDFCNNLEMM